MPNSIDNGDVQGDLAQQLRTHTTSILPGVLQICESSGSDEPT